MTDPRMTEDLDELRARGDDPLARRILTADEEVDGWLEDFAGSGDFATAWSAATEPAPTCSRAWPAVIIGLAAAAALALAVLPALRPDDPAPASAVPAAPVATVDRLDLELGGQATLDLQPNRITIADPTRVAAIYASGRTRLQGLRAGRTEIVFGLPDGDSRTLEVEVGGGGTRTTSWVRPVRPVDTVVLHVGAAHLLRMDGVPDTITVALPDVVGVAADQDPTLLQLIPRQPGSTYLWAQGEGLDATWRVVVESDVSCEEIEMLKQLGYVDPATPCVAPRSGGDR
ncbi:MAG: pilus assembly protein N-terminal domain-containing protein [Myxococcales bacterium]|nr:pilus assembly protein N-terminal domain-containing protein [Myxococcales bacterium]